MIDIDTFMADIERRYAVDRDRAAPSLAEAKAWIARSDGGLSSLFDPVAGRLARGYFDGRYAFEFCDLVVNQLYWRLIALVEPWTPWPRLFERVYDAFDAGEFHRRADRTDDPVAEFTDPAIAAIVGEL